MWPEVGIEHRFGPSLEAILRRYFTLPWIVVAIHTTALIAAALSYFLRWIDCPPPFDDIYPPYFFISGPASFFVAVFVSEKCSRPLLSVLTYHHASVIAILIVPGLINAVLGGVQWYWITRLFWSPRLSAKNAAVGFPLD
jgi:hypothetical protein